MKTHTNDYKNEIKQFGKEIDSKITFTSGGQTIELGKEDLNSITPHYEGSILKSVMKQLDVDSNVEIPEGTVINYQFGLKVNDNYEYLNFGNYVVYSVEKQEDTRSYKITCYDKMLYAMKDYESLGVEYPITIKDYLIAICDKLGLSLKNDYFINYDKTIQSELYLDSDGNSLDYTFRDVLDEIAQATGSTVCINDDDELEVRYINNAGEQTTTLEGTNISIANAEDSKVKDLQLQGNTTQETTTGKNLLVNTNHTQTISGITFTINEDKSITIKGTATAQAVFRINETGSYTLNAGNYVLSTVNNLPTGVVLQGWHSSATAFVVLNPSSNIKTTTLSENVSNVRFQIVISNGTNLSSGITIYPMLESGSTASSYEPYTNGASPNPTYPQPINVVSGRQLITTSNGNETKNYEINLGKNLLRNDLSILQANNTGGTWEGNIYSQNGTTFTCNDDGSITVNGAPSSNTNFYINRTGTNYQTSYLEAGTYYLTSHETTGSNSTWKLQVSLDGTSTNVFGTGNNKEPSRTITTGMNITTVALIIYSGYNPNGATFYPMISKSQGTDYAPYKTPIELCKIGTYQGHIFKAKDGDSVYDNLSQETKDTLTYGSWYIEKQIDKIVLKGSEEWYHFSVAQGHLFRVNDIIPNVIQDNTKIPMCDYYHAIPYSEQPNRANNDIYISLGGQIDIINNNYTTVADFKTWLSTHNTTVYYVLQTPTYTEITDSELLVQLNAPRLLEGINNITISSSDLSSPLKITYVSGIDTIDEEYLKDINVNFGEKFGKVNSIVLSRSAESDNVYIQDEASIEENGLCEIKIKDNQIMNDNNRDTFLPGLLEALDGLEYYINDFTSTGITYYDLCDKYFVSIDGKKYKCIMFNNEVDITQGLEEQVYTEMPEESETDYNTASKTDRTRNRAQIIVNKQEAEIQQLASKIVNVSNTISGLGSITLDNAYTGILHRLEITGNITKLLPKTTLYPSNNLTPVDTWLSVDGTRYFLDIDYLSYTNAEVHDTFIYEDGKCWIERANGTIEEKTDLDIYVDKESVITLEYYNTCRLNCIYLLENEYTSTFANQVEVTSELNLLADTIEAKVSQVADEDGNVTSASIILAVNNDTSSAQIEADKISLEGKEINLTSDDIVIKSNRFNVDKYGNLTCTGASLTGGDINMISNNYNSRVKLTGESYGGAQATNELVADGLRVDVAGAVDDLPCINLRASSNGGDLFLRDLSRQEFSWIGYWGMVTGTGIGSPQAGMYSDGEVHASYYTGGSLESIKKNIGLFDKSAVDIIRGADIYEYNLKQEDDKENKHIGLVIGDKKKKYNTPEEVISKKRDGVDLYSMISMSWKAIKELAEQNEKLQEEINKLKKEMNK